MTHTKQRLLALTTAAASVMALTAAFAPAATSAASDGSAAPTVRSACSNAPAGSARCYAEYVVPGTASPHAALSPRAVSPADIQKYYGLSATAGAGKTVAIVDAYDNPNAESDLAHYRSANGLPACTTANGCFKKVNQNGNTSPLPAGDTGWGLEIALDLDAVSAACPACKILLVEGNSASFANLATAVNTAVSLGATTVSNSYGANEGSYVSTYASSYNHPGVPILASTGDNGYETVASYPAVYSTVIAVGGTLMTPTKNGSGRGFTEKAWSGAGSGCSTFIAKPSWQTDTGCAGRTIADTSADADPNSGLLVYDTYGYSGDVQVGGTSLSSPLVAAMTAMGNTNLNNASYLYAHKSSFTDVKKGSNGSCASAYLCNAVKGYDGPTGIGSPNGVGGL